MTRDDIIRMAREAGFTCDCWLQKTPLHRFAELVAAAEREACAKVCEDQKETGAHRRCAAAIRARNQPPKNGD